MILNLNNEQQRQKFDQYSKNLLEAKCKVEIKKIQDSRSARQNRALHMFFTIMSQNLNDMGLEFTYQGLNVDMISMRYTPEIVKLYFWKPIQLTLFNESSTTKINTQQINEILDVIIKFFGERSVLIEFPSMESLMNQEK